MPRLKEMVSIYAEEEMARWLARADPPRSPAATPILAVVRAIAWHLRVGGPWRALPPSLPPGTASPFFPPGDRLRRWRTVYGWFRRWLDHGLLDASLCEIAKLRRRAPVQAAFGHPRHASRQVHRGARAARL
jgi:putative transposase